MAKGEANLAIGKRRNTSSSKKRQGKKKKYIYIYIYKRNMALITKIQY